MIDTLTTSYIRTGSNEFIHKSITSIGIALKHMNGREYVPSKFAHDSDSAIARDIVLTMTELEIEVLVCLMDKMRAAGPGPTSRDVTQACMISQQESERTLVNLRHLGATTKSKGRHALTEYGVELGRQAWRLIDDKQ